MDDLAQRPDVMAAGVPLLLLILASATSLAAWVGAHVLHTRHPGHGVAAWAGLAIRAAVGTLTLWLGTQCLSRGVVLTTHWPLWSWAALGGLSVETVIALYSWERRTSRPEIGRWVVRLRVAAVLLALLMLLQPVISSFVKRGVERMVIVLLDDSGSMHMEDRQMTPSEKLGVAELYGLDAVSGRRRLGAAIRDVGEVHRNLLAEAERLQSRGSEPEPMRQALVDRLDALRKSVKAARATLVLDQEYVDAAWNDRGKYDGPAQAALDGARNSLRDDVMSRVNGLRDLLDKTSGDDANDAKAVQTFLKGTAESLLELLKKLPVAAVSADEVFYKGLGEPARKQMDDLALKTRAEVAREVLTSSREKTSILDRIRETYRLRIVRFGARIAEVDPAAFEGGDAAGKKDAVAELKDRSFRKSTDITAAIEDVVKDIPAENLAGILLVSDGLHNGQASVDAIARKLGVQGAPIGAVMVGGSMPPRDASVLRVNVPESVFLGDKVAIKADIKLDGLRGQKVKVRLMDKGALVQEKTVDVPEDQFRTQVRFSQTPPAEGIYTYSVEIEAIPGELMADNNRSEFDVAVSNDRTNVLIVEDRPRWEFRYLRNLLYGRDKSVHLQYVLLTPDAIDGAGATPVVSASAARKFGDAEATALPANKDEWMKFDVIILGDIPPRVLDENVMGILRDCVSERGTLLITVAGPRYMPHAFESPILKDLLPVQYAVTPNATCFKGPELAYRLRVTPEGRQHTITRISSSSSENTQIWGEFPVLYWRHDIKAAKEGAEVLAYAEPMGGEKPAAAVAEDAGSLDENARKLADERRLRSRNALIVAQPFGQGKVLMMNFDGIWRLRYKVGDTYHHRFWGQALRWGASENLRAGNDYVRLGTDKVTYSPDEPIHVVARITSPDFKPVNNDRVSVTVSLGQKVVLKKTIEYRKGSNGMYETMLKPLPEAGRYRIELQGAEVARILGETKLDKVETALTVSAESSVEISELAASRTVPNRLASLSGGAVSGVEDASRLVDLFGPGSQLVKERKDVTLWDSWALLLLILGCVSAEWILRKRGGLT